MENAGDKTGDGTKGPDRPEARLRDEFLEKLLFSSLTPEEQAELAPTDKADNESLRRFVEAIHLREALYDYGSSLPRVDAIHENCRESKGGDGSIVTPSASSLNRSVGTLTSKRAYWLPLAMATCLAMMLSAAGGYWASGVKPFTSADTTHRPFASSSVLAGLTQAREAGRRYRLGKITALSPDASSDGLLRSLQVGEELRRGEVIQLTRGAMRVGFTAGPEVLVEGPAEFSVVADRAMFVHRGSVKTTSDGEFTVQTPLVAVASMDAEIGVVANGVEPTSVFAFSGDAKVQSNPHRRIRYEILKELSPGQGIQVSLDEAAGKLGVEQADQTPEMLVGWGQVVDKFHPYEQLVLSDRPLAYWPLYRVRRNRRVLDLTQNGFDGQAIGNWPSELSDASGTQVRGAFFDGESYIEPDSKPPVDLASGFTIEGWARLLGGPEFQSVFTSRWVFESNTPNQQCFGFTLYAGDDDCWQFWSGSGEYGAVWQALVAPVKIDRQRWTHVAATFTPRRVEKSQFVEGLVELFVDGQKVGEDTHRLSLMDFEWPARIGAAEFVPKSLTSWLFHGELRDIALYDYPLPPAKLQQHQEAGQTAT